jgi:hypothetical protein
LSCKKYDTTKINTFVVFFACKNIILFPQRKVRKKYKNFNCKKETTKVSYFSCILLILQGSFVVKMCETIQIYKHALTNALPLIWLAVLALWETHTNAVAAFE